MDISNISVTWSVDKVFITPVIQENKNVITRVFLLAKFTRGEVSGTRNVQCTLNTDNLIGFIDIQNVSDEQIISWAVETLTSEQIDSWKKSMIMQLDEKDALKGLVLWQIVKTS